MDKQQALTAGLEQVGGKAASLARLAGTGVPVPDFFVVTSRAFEQHLEHNDLVWPVSDDAEPIEQLSTRIETAAMPGAVHEALMHAYQELMPANLQPVVAVRSSGAGEDSGPASFAGQFTTTLGVAGSGVARAVQDCWASCLSSASLAYRRSRGIALGTGPGFAVVVQAQIFADRAGVLFTRHPLEPRGDVAYVEANFGTGESVVGGMVTPDSVSVSRSTGKVLKVRIGSKNRMTVVSESERGSRVMETEPGRRNAQVLSGAEAEQLVGLGLRIEEQMGQPQDIEWAFDASGLWILQARPQTGLPE